MTLFARVRSYGASGPITVAALLMSAAALVLLVRAFWPGLFSAPPSGDGYKALNAELSMCIDRTVARTVPGSISIDQYREVWRLCETQMYDQLLLNDFAIRREKFDQNSLDERVNMWLVVIITLSGVILAATQLWMSFTLAVDAKGQLGSENSFDIEQGKMSFKSSITGLMMMALSLVFFVVYVKWIYANYDVITSRPASVYRNPAWVADFHPPGKELPGEAGLGPPPIESGAKTPVQQDK